MTANGAKKRGNSFLRRAAGIFVLVHFFILSRPPIEKIYLNQTIGHTKHTLETLKNNERAKLDQLKREKRNNLVAGLSAKTSKRGSSKIKASASDVAIIPAVSIGSGELDQVQDPLTDDKIRDVQHRIAEIDKDWVLLEQAKYERSLKIPGTDASIGETDIKNCYPLGLALALLVLGVYRRAVLRASEPSEFVPPFWAAPIPLHRYPIHRFRWLVLNVAGLTLLGISCILFWRFSHRDEFFTNGFWTLINSIAAIAVLGFYAWQFIQAIFLGRAKPQQKATAA